MKLKVGNGLFRYVPAHAVSSIGNYRKVNADSILKNMCEVITLNGDTFLCDGDLEKFIGLIEEELKTRKG